MIFLFAHFSIISLYLAGNFTDSKPFKIISAWYVTPFFEQQWSMFAPYPPASNVDFYVMYKDSFGNESPWYDLKKPIVEFNRVNFFGTSQRLIKYFHGTLNNIFYRISEDPSIKNQDDLHVHIYETPGFQCLQNYIALHSRSIIPMNSDLNYLKFRLLVMEKPVSSFGLTHNEDQRILLETGYIKFDDQL